MQTSLHVYYSVSCCTQCSVMGDDLYLFVIGPCDVIYITGWWLMGYVNGRVSPTLQYMGSIIIVYSIGRC